MSETVANLISKYWESTFFVHNWIYLFFFEFWLIICLLPSLWARGICTHRAHVWQATVNPSFEDHVKTCVFCSYTRPMRLFPSLFVCTFVDRVAPIGRVVCGELCIRRIRPLLLFLFSNNNYRSGTVAYYTPTVAK